MQNPSELQLSHQLYPSTQTNEKTPNSLNVSKKKKSIRIKPYVYIILVIKQIAIQQKWWARLEISRKFSLVNKKEYDYYNQATYSIKQMSSSFPRKPAWGKLKIIRSNFLILKLVRVFILVASTPWIRDAPSFTKLSKFDFASLYFLMTASTWRDHWIT